MLLQAGVFSHGVSFTCGLLLRAGVVCEGCGWMMGCFEIIYFSRKGATNLFKSRNATIWIVASSS